MSFLYEICEERGERFIEITGYDGNISILTVPQQLRAVENGCAAGSAVLTELSLSAELLPVRSIGSHAFEGRRDLKEVYLPESVRRLRAFAFHNCESLRRVTVCDSADDYYDGVFRHCTSLRLIELYSEGRNYSLMKAILEDNDGALRFLLHLPGEDIRLSFPAYALIASENTMARTIQFAYEGGGYAYRECVRKREIRFREYDRLFPFTMRDDPEIAAEIAADRLMYPHDLDLNARGLYEKFLRESASLALRLFIMNRETERVRFMARAGLPDEDAILGALRLASERNETAICAVLMDSGRHVPQSGPGHAEGADAQGMSLTGAGKGADAGDMSSNRTGEGTPASESGNGRRPSKPEMPDGMDGMPGFGLELEDW